MHSHTDRQADRHTDSKKSTVKKKKNVTKRKQQMNIMFSIYIFRVETTEKNASSCVCIVHEESEETCGIPCVFLEVGKTTTGTNDN